MGGLRLFFLAAVVATTYLVLFLTPQGHDSVKLRLTGRDQCQLRIASKVLLSHDSLATEEEWHLKVLRAFLPLTQANSGAVRSTDKGDFRMTPVGFDASVIAVYRDYYQRFDYGRALGGHQAHGQLFSRNNYYGEDLPSFRKSEFYSDYLAKNRFLDAMCLSTRRDMHDSGSVIYFWYDNDLSEPERARVVALLRLMEPAFQAGMASRADLRSRHGQLFSTLDNDSDGCALFTHSGVLLHRNPALCRLLGTCSQPETLAMEINAQVEQVRLTLFSPDRHSALVPRCTRDCFSGTTLFRVSTCSLDTNHSGSNASILVTVARLGPPLTDSSTSEKLRARFGLTSREGEVALLLHQRLTNREIAAELGMSEHTARHHTESIMSKLQIAGRGEVRARISEEISRSAPP